jgi:HEPN domain-containing protein
MAALNAHLSDAGVKPHHRPIHIAKRLWEAFGWGGNVFPPESLAMQPCYEGDVLMAKAQQWYEQTLGARLQTSRDMARVPLVLAGTVWQLRIVEWHGTANFFINRDLSNVGRQGIQGKELPSANILTFVEELPQGLVDRLSDDDLHNIFRFYMFAMRGVEWRNNLPSTPFFKMARGDYDSSNQDIFEGRYGQGRWMALQSVEKIFKGLLALGGHQIPWTHDLHKLANLVQEKHSIKVHPSIIELAQCQANVRYEESSTQAQAVNSNHAVLGVFDALKDNEAAMVLIREAQ